MSQEVIIYQPGKENLQLQDLIEPPFTDLAGYWKLTRYVWNKMSQIDQKRESEFNRKNPQRPNEDVETQITSVMGYAQQRDPIVFSSTKVNVYEPLDPDRYFPWSVLKDDLRKERRQIREKWTNDTTQEQKAIDLLSNTLKQHYLFGESSQYCSILSLGKSLDNDGLSNGQQLVFDYCRLQGLPVVIESELPTKPLKGPREYFIGIDMKAFEEKLAEQNKRKSWTETLKKILTQK